MQGLVIWIEFFGIFNMGRIVGFVLFYARDFREPDFGHNVFRIGLEGPFVEGPRPLYLGLHEMDFSPFVKARSVIGINVRNFLEGLARIVPFSLHALDLSLKHERRKIFGLGGANVLDGVFGVGIYAVCIQGLGIFKHVFAVMLPINDLLHFAQRIFRIAFFLI